MFYIDVFLGRFTKWKFIFDIKNKRKNVETQDAVETKETWIFMDIECWIDQNISFQ